MQSLGFYAPGRILASYSSHDCELRRTGPCHLNLSKSTSYDTERCRGLRAQNSGRVVRLSLCERLYNVAYLYCHQCANGTEHTLRTVCVGLYMRVRGLLYCMIYAHAAAVRYLAQLG